MKHRWLVWVLVLSLLSCQKVATPTNVPDASSSPGPCLSGIEPGPVSVTAEFEVDMKYSDWYRSVTLFLDKNPQLIVIPAGENVKSEVFNLTPREARQAWDQIYTVLLHLTKGGEGRPVHTPFCVLVVGEQRFQFIDHTLVLTNNTLCELTDPEEQPFPCQVLGEMANKAMSAR